MLHVVSLFLYSSFTDADSFLTYPKRIQNYWIQNAIQLLTAKRLLFFFCVHTPSDCSVCFPPSCIRCCILVVRDCPLTRITILPSGPHVHPPTQPDSLHSLHLQSLRDVWTELFLPPTKECSVINNGDKEYKVLGRPDPLILICSGTNRHSVLNHKTECSLFHIFRGEPRYHKAEPRYSSRNPVFNFF